MNTLNGLKSFLKKYDDVVQSRQDNNDICAAEFQAIKVQSAEDKKDLLSLDGAKEANKKKNRYKDILPYDHSRVVLDRDKFIDCSDYINANHVEDASGKRSYIAAQGPMPHTVDDFWRMIWQFKVKVVVMGCKEIEMGRNRCHRYWAETGEEKWFNDIKVILVATRQYAHNMVLRELKAEKKGVVHNLCQLHYMDWPDHGAPETSETILQLIKVLREKQPDDDPPVLIHCSAGCGRTGAIIAIDCGRKLIQSHANYIDVLAIVSRLRKQRPALVQSKDQYEFIYQVFCEMVHREIKLREGEYDCDYMNINALPTKKDVPVTIPSPQTVSQSKANVSQREMILPQEHAVNTDGGCIRRSRSAYIKKSTAPKVAIPPNVPIKENKLKLNEGPLLPPKSPTLAPISPSLPPKSSPSVPQKAHRNKFESSNLQAVPDRNYSSSFKHKVQSKPPLHKKPSLDSFFVDSKTDSDYINLERQTSGITPQEDFIPAPTPVGFCQYPMLTKMSHSTTSHPKVPMKPTLGINKGIDIQYSSNKNSIPPVPIECHSEQLQELHAPMNQFSVSNKTPVRDEYAVVDKSKNAMVLECNNIRDEYAVVDKSKKIGNDVLPKDISLYENISSVARPNSNNLASSNVEDVISSANKNEQIHPGLEEPKQTPKPVILPYKVTDVGFGYKKKTETTRRPSNDVVSKATAREAPVVPMRRGISFPPGDSKDVADGLYSEIPHQPTEITHQFEKLTHQTTENPPPSSKKWFNDKIRHLAKRPSSSSSITLSDSIAWKQPFCEINDKYGFPHRLPMKPAGPRLPPSSWKVPAL